MQRAEVMAPSALRLAADLLTAALAAGVDTLAWLDEIGAHASHRVAAIEVLADLLDFINTVYDRPGVATQTIAPVLAH